MKRVKTEREKGVATKGGGGRVKTTKRGGI